MDRNYPGPCSTCCVCPTPYLQLVNRSASKSACGFANHADGILYLQKTENFENTSSQTCDAGSCNSSTSYASISTFNLDSSGSCISDQGVPYISSTGSGESTLVVFRINSPYSPVTLNYGSQYLGGNIWNPIEGYYFDVSGPMACVDCNVGGWIPVVQSTTYANPYTQGMMESYANLDAVPWPDLGPPDLDDDGPITSAEIASIELSLTSFSVMDGRYQWWHSLPSGGIYKLKWIERFTPDSGAVVDTPRAYQWNGTKPPGYNLADPSTWPTSPVFEVDHPSANGSISVVELTVDCGGGPVAA